MRVGGRRCAVGRATPLSALAGTRLKLGFRDYGSCGRSPRDAGALYVKRIGADRARGAAGWVYKVGRRAGTTGAADPSGPFGRGKLKRGARVLWFWCVQVSGEACQRTLEVASAPTVAPGAMLAVTVRGYDDNGRGCGRAGSDGPARLGDGGLRRERRRAGGCPGERRGPADRRACGHGAVVAEDGARPVKRLLGLLVLCVALAGCGLGAGDSPPPRRHRGHGLAQLRHRSRSGTTSARRSRAARP